MDICYCFVTITPQIPLKTVFYDVHEAPIALSFHLGVCPRENQTDVTRAISPTALKLSQINRFIKEIFKTPKLIGLSPYLRGIRVVV